MPEPALLYTLNKKFKLITVNGNKACIGNDNLKQLLIAGPTIWQWPWVLPKGSRSGILLKGAGSKVLSKGPGSRLLSKSPGPGVLPKEPGSGVLAEGLGSYFSSIPQKTTYESCVTLFFNKHHAK